jgi:hypothetical protein
MPRSYQATPTGLPTSVAAQGDLATNGKKWWSEPPRPPLILTLSEVVFDSRSPRGVVS